MKCNLCHERPATAHIRTQRNQQVFELHLCTECMAKVQAGYKLPSALGGFDFGSAIPGMNDLFAQFRGVPREAQVRTQTSGGGFLDQFGRNLTRLAADGRIDPLIGRDKEIARTIEILNRRNKNNPVLIGEPGVGKTAVVEGLALRIVQGQVPSKLRDKQIYAIDVASLVADTGIRGQFEERMQGLIRELESRDDVIAFIDEIHLLVGAGSAQGSMDAGNILKPALARGDLQVIGATTLKEYRQIEKDAALERRFQPVTVNEPSVDEAIAILQGIRSKYEEFHQVQFTDEAVRACVTLSQRYIADRFLPDKAIDLMDEAGSKANLAQADGRADDIQARLAALAREKAEAARVEAYERAAELHREEMQLREQLASLAAQGSQSKRPTVTERDIAAIVEGKTGIPVTKVETDEQTKLRHLEEDLAQYVIGQPQAVKQVAKAVRRSRVGLRKGDRPIGSFLFVGPTGVGKTELAKRLAERLFGSKDAMIRLDMSEYMEKHAVSKLIGSPPGYVGYEEAGQLTEQVRRKPYSLILLDEIEKAHPDVQHIFLQIMEDGRLTDSQGRTVSFKDTILIMTSNAGVMERKSTVGFALGENKHDVSTESNADQLTAYFKPEFLNRFDAIVQFSPLAEADIARIVELFLGERKEWLAEQGVELSWTPEAVKVLAARGYHPTLGARPLRRAIQELVEDPIADLLIDHEHVQAVRIDGNDGALVVKPAMAAGTT
ncbi:ATP-dependent Clp protease ATP-binding subunit ClpE [Alicyclobacillus hesperidum]|uniref:ATP-dependent Clp protease ATP-binding subunit ClpE n=1 Tax=Alicyclobacillus hesperidum TaxID=89784 RepID=A0A1H2S3N1_9BACL|nr:ATP-dependent Clp protease ATP-binding subunit [Alicyclobacillus hesperidum]GLV13353.1 ATP-dependent Clp protease ATP-binding subunit ClpE [Alicyclobacillus hesperidum]SDW26221.1 ATP-dependent Clp protease ATP-binding subunit ClpE [Alicyclobacillus hesperidum]